VALLISLQDLFSPRPIEMTTHIKPQPEWATKRNFAPMIGRTADGREFKCAISDPWHTVEALQACRERVYQENQKLGPGHIGWVLVAPGSLVGDGAIPHDHLSGNVCIVAQGGPLGTCGP